MSCSSIVVVRPRIPDSHRNTAEFVDDDHPSLSFLGLNSFETHLTTASPGRHTSRFPAWQ